MLIGSKPIVLMGFKHVGKTQLAQALALHYQTDWFDLDQSLEKHYAKHNEVALTCRQIVQCRGVDFFQALEHRVFRAILAVKPAVIALGGATPLLLANQALLQSTLCIHLCVAADSVYRRIMANSPAFLGEHPRETFERLWQEREPVYRRLADVAIDNNGPVIATALALAAIVQQKDN